MPIWSKLWSALDSYVLWMLDSDSEAMVREVACYVPLDPREDAMADQSDPGADLIDDPSARVAL